MSTTKEHDAQIAKLTFAEVYPHHVTKVEKKGRTTEELHEVINWLTGFDDKELQKLVDKEVTFQEFFAIAKLNPNAKHITGSICGYRIEDIKTPLTRKIRYPINWWTSSPRVVKWRKFSAPDYDGTDLGGRVGEITIWLKLHSRYSHQYR